MFKKLLIYHLWIILLLLAPDFMSLAHGETIAFGPETYIRDKGKPQRIANTFSVDTGHLSFAISIKNGDEKRQRVTSAVIEINGQLILGPEEFSKEVAEIIVPVRLKEQNEIAVEIRGEPGASIIVKIFRSGIPDIFAAADPDYVNLSADTTVTILAFPEEPNPISINLTQYDDKYNPIVDLGILYDDGTHGDRKAGDNDFTTQITINKSSPEMLYYRVSAFYKETFKKVISNFFSINATEIPSVSQIISPQGGTITLDEYATVTFPASVFSSNNTITVSATSSPETEANYIHSGSIYKAGTRLPYEVRINSGYIKPATPFDIVLKVPDFFISTLHANAKIIVFAQIDQGDIDNFEVFPSTFDSITKTIRLTLSAVTFTETRRLDKTYEAIVIVGTTLK